MVETLINNKWESDYIIKDLINQGINPQDINNLGVISIEYKNSKIVYWHTYKSHLAISIENKHQGKYNELITAFSEILEYKPFCNYKFTMDNKEFISFEWSKNPNKRYNQLEKIEQLENLLKMEEYDNKNTISKKYNTIAHI